MNNPIKVCQLSDAHTIYDDRIYWKYCISLKKQGYEVVYIGLSDKDCRLISDKGVQLIGVARKKYLKNLYLNKLVKFLLKKELRHEIFKLAKDQHADIYHFHNINLNRIGIKLKKLPQKPKVIYDVREPYSQHIRDYNQTKGISTFIKNCYANWIEKWEINCAKHYDFLISNEENVANHFISKGIEKEKVEVIYNYTNLNSDFERLPFNDKVYDAIYCGVITRFRGAIRMLEALNLLKKEKKDVKFLFLGPIYDLKLQDEIFSYVKDNNLTENIEITGFVPYNEVHNFYLKSKVALGIFLPIKTHFIILQIKIFEYMAYGLPIVCSNFGHIRNYTLKYNAGKIVDPENPEEICKEIFSIISDEDLYWKYSNNGIEAARKFFRWEIMEEKLFNIYSVLSEN